MFTTLRKQPVLLLDCSVLSPMRWGIVVGCKLAWGRQDGMKICMGDWT